MSAVNSCAVCQIPAHLKCSRCRSVSYCGREHQKKDWQNHRYNSCLPYMMYKSEVDDRRYVYSTRDIKKGEIILVETPLAMSSVINACAGCFKLFTMEKTVVCPRCKWPVCDRNCPGLTDPSLHGMECELLWRIKSKTVAHNTESLMPLRCLLLQKRDPEKWKVLMDLALLAEALPVKRSEGESLIYLEEAILKPLSSTAPHLLPPDCSPETLQRIVNSIQSFGVSVRRFNYGELVGLFGVTSYMNHSCMPNTQLIYIPPQYFDGQKKSAGVVVRAATDIGQRCRIYTSFVDLRDPTMVRQRNLLNYRDRQCRCERCVDPRELGTDFGTLRCTICSGWMLPLDTPHILFSDWRCEKCGKTLSTVYLMEVLEELRSEAENNQFLPQHVRFDRIIKIIKKMEKIVHPNHSLLFLQKMALVVDFQHEIYVVKLTDLTLRESTETCRELLKLMVKPCLVSHMTGLICSVAFALFNLNMEIMKRNKTSKKIDWVETERIKTCCSELKTVARRFSEDDFSQSDIDFLCNDIRLSPF